jgi:hypothetical protein
MLMDLELFVAELDGGVRHRIVLETAHSYLSARNSNRDRFDQSASWIESIPIKSPGAPLGNGTRPLVPGTRAINLSSPD